MYILYSIVVIMENKENNKEILAGMTVEFNALGYHMTALNN